MDPITEQQVSPAVSSLSDGFTAFGLRLHRQLPTGGNALFSPLSVAAALAALLPGARGGTAREMADVLGIDGTPERTAASMSELHQALRPRTLVDHEWNQETGESIQVEREAFRLTLASALFVEEGYPLLTEYCDLLEASYGTGFFSVLFADAEAAAGRINTWVEEKTAGRIPQLVSSGDVEEARLVLANAVYFKAQWRDQFSEYATRPQAFFLPPGSGAESVEVAMMRRQGSFHYWRDEARDLEAVRLPYEQGSSMIVMLPAAGAYEEVGKSLSTQLLADVANVHTWTLLDLQLPRFELRSEFRLPSALKALGIRQAFEVGNADFSGITPTHEGLVLSEAVHQAWMKVDENGTEAAAATAMMALAGGAPEEVPVPIPFVVDRPFYFFVRDDRTGAVLFMGRVTDPSG